MTRNYIHDQIGRVIKLEAPAKRIVCLVPSISETICALGAEDKLVGVTRFCVHPNSLLEDKTVVGGTKKIVPARVEALNPDLILLNKEENTEEIMEQCKQIATCYVSQIKTAQDAIEMIRHIGGLLQLEDASASVARKISSKLDAMDTQKKPTPKALYLIWNKPMMSVGGDTFIHHMMEMAGLQNVLAGTDRYPVVDDDAIRDLKPDVILLSSEPYEFTEADVSAFAKAYNTPTLLVNGEMFSWYGVRMLAGINYLKQVQAKIYATCARNS